MKNTTQVSISKSSSSTFKSSKRKLSSNKNRTSTVTKITAEGRIAKNASLQSLIRRFSKKRKKKKVKMKKSITTKSHAKTTRKFPTLNHNKKSVT